MRPAAAVRLQHQRDGKEHDHRRPLFPPVDRERTRDRHAHEHIHVERAGAEGAKRAPRHAPAPRGNRRTEQPSRRGSRGEHAAGREDRRADRRQPLGVAHEKAFPRCGRAPAPGAEPRHAKRLKHRRLRFGGCQTELTAHRVELIRPGAHRAIQRLAQDGLLGRAADAGHQVGGTVTPRHGARPAGSDPRYVHRRACRASCAPPAGSGRGASPA